MVIIIQMDWMRSRKRGHRRGCRLEAINKRRNILDGNHYSNGLE